MQTKHSKVSSYRNGWDNLSPNSVLLFISIFGDDGLGDTVVVVGFVDWLVVIFSVVTAVVVSIIGSERA